MGRFVGTGEERSVVNKYIDSYMRGTSEYAKYLQAAPNFVTYFSRDQAASTENSGLGDVEEIVGLRSPLRYNRVHNVPLYMVEDSAPELLADGVMGVGYTVESTAVIIPDTVVPVPNDVFTFSYWERGEAQKEVLFRVTNVTTTAVDSNTYYQISFQSTPYDKQVLEANQLVDCYEVVYDHVGSQKPAILVEEDYLLATEVERLFEQAADIYIEDYYKYTLIMFFYKRGDDAGREVVYFYNNINDFLRRKKFFISSKSLGTNILLDDLHVARSSRLFSPYDVVGAPTLTGTYILESSSLPIFKLFPLQVKELFYFPKGDEEFKIEETIQRLYTDIFSVNQPSTKQQLVTNFRKAWLSNLQKFLPKVFPSLEMYLSLPILLYVLDWMGEFLVRGDQPKQPEVKIYG